MKTIKVTLYGKFRPGIILVGKRVKIDRLKGNPTSKNHIMARVTNLWKRPQWWDVGWFDFEEEKRK